LAGVLIALALPPWGFWVLAFPGAGLLWWRLGGLRLRARMLAGFVAGLGMFVPGLWWVTSFNTYGGVVLMVIESLAPALACALVPRTGRGRGIALTGAMVLAEALRATWPFGGLPIGGVALGQAGSPVAGAARLGGPLLVVGLVWLGGFGLAMLAGPALRLARPAAGARTLDDRSFTPLRVRETVGTGALALAVVVVLAAWGAVAPDGGRALRTLRVAAVQGGGVRGLRQSEVDTTAVYDAQMAATAEIGSSDGARPPSLVLWPEDVVALDGPLAGSPQEQQLAALAVHLRSTLVVGVTEDVPGGQFRNEAVAFSPAGRLVARFEKVHRVPFGEYVPYRGFFEHLASLSSVPLDAVPGHGDGVLHTPAGRLGTLISYEVFYADRGRVATRAGAQLLIVPTNTSSYLTSQVPTQEIAAARLQAIAEGRDLVQAAPTGFSAVIDHRGHVLQRTALAKRSVIVADVAMRAGRTLYERGGDLPVVLASVVLVATGWIVAGVFGPDRTRRDDSLRRTRRRRP
jgi:apolipoprotein N-acyltransferase